MTDNQYQYIIQSQMPGIGLLPAWKEFLPTVRTEHIKSIEVKSYDR